MRIGKSIDGNKIDKLTGSTPYITRKERDNGLDGFTDQPEEYINANYPVITIGNETAEPFVQDFPFFTGTKVNILTPKTPQTRQALLFVAQSLRVHKAKYSYAFTINSTRLTKQVIQLPIDDSGRPDWPFMEAYMREREELLLARYTRKAEGECEEVTLEGVKWGEFVISDVAEIIAGRGIFDEERRPGKIPYITSSAFSNGVTHFISNTNETLEANCISVNSNGSVGYAFYHPYEALYSGDCRKLRPKVKGRHVALFLATTITAQKDKYNYGYKLGTARLKRQKILLPIDANGQPDYAFMERFMSFHERRLVKAYVKYLQEKLRNAPKKKLLSLEGIKWGKFKIGDVFVILPGKRLRKEDMTPGNKPFIGASDSNNGVTAFVSNSNASEDSNVLGVNYNGSVVESFYHPYTCIFSDDVKRFKLRHAEGSKYIYEFMKTMILQQKVKYTYGYKFSEQRMQRQMINLPVNDAGEPDYEFMSEFMRGIEQEKYFAALSYFVGKLEGRA